MKRRLKKFPAPTYSPLDKERAYRYYKMMWQAAHPASTPAEYEAWVRKITKELDL